jgi:hypothetical protein
MIRSVLGLILSVAFFSLCLCLAAEQLKLIRRFSAKSALDHPVSAAEQVEREGEAKCPCGLHVDR